LVMRLPAWVLPALTTSIFILLAVSAAMEVAGFTVREQASPGAVVCPSTITLTPGERFTPCYFPYLIIHPFTRIAALFTVAALILAAITLGVEAARLRPE